MWLRDDLPRSMPTARIIIYGYDSKLQGSKSFQSILDIGIRFQAAVRRARPLTEKPLVFLGHSLGGLLIKEVSQVIQGPLKSQIQGIDISISHYTS